MKPWSNIASNKEGIQTLLLLLLFLPVLDATKDYALEKKQTHNIGLQVPLGTIIPYLSSNKWLRWGGQEDNLLSETI